MTSVALQMNFAETFLDESFAQFGVAPAEPTVLAFSTADRKPGGFVRYDGPLTPKPLVRHAAHSRQRHGRECASSSARTL